jgi:hypothetical protein
MARASTYTLLPLDEYARILGISPPHFNQAAGATVFPANGSCPDVWWQYAWQHNDQVSREDLATAIRSAEDEIARFVGYYPAPVWIAGEPHQYPRPFARNTYGFGVNVRGQGKSIKLDFNKLQSPGRRAVTLIEAGATVTYSDPDSDGYDELATITASTTLTDECELKIYFAGEGGDQEWEVRPVLTKTISGGVVTFTVESWKLIDPDLWEQYPNVAFNDKTGALKSIDLEAAASYVSTVDVYREFTDTTAVSAQFFWERQPNLTGVPTCCTSCGGIGCEVCTLRTQDGCFQVRGVDNGLAVPFSASYDADTAAWQRSAWLECREPDQVKLWYKAGDLGRKNRRGDTCQELSRWWAQTIAWLATARLERPLCSCGNSTNLAEAWMKDLAISKEGESIFVSENDLDNPFGTKKGEIMAWKRLSKFKVEMYEGAAI